MDQSITQAQQEVNRLYNERVDALKLTIQRPIIGDDPWHNIPDRTWVEKLEKEWNL